MVPTNMEIKRDSMDVGVSDIKIKLEAATPQQRPLSLRDLPASVRSKIYGHVLDTELVNLGKPNVSYKHTIKDGVLQFSASRTPFPVETALFYVSKQLGKEANQWFYRKNLFVKFEIYTSDARHAKTMLEDSGVLFATPNASVLEKCTQHAMDLALIEKENSKKRASVIFPAQYVPRLISFMDQAGRASGRWAPTHTLSMGVRNTYNLEVARLQGDLLELFRILTNFGAVTIEKENLLPGYAEGLQASMTAKSFDVDIWLATIDKMKDRAAQALKETGHQEAIQYCQSVIISMTYAYLTRAEALHMKPDAFHRAIQRLRHSTELVLSKALRLLTATTNSAFAPTSTLLLTSPLLSLHTAMPDPYAAKAAAALLAAESAVSHALSLATDSPSPAANPWFHTLPPELIPPNKADWFTDMERGQTYFEAGKVHLALGEFLFAAGDLERAEQLVCETGDGELIESVSRKFERAREGIDWSVRPGTGLRRAGWIAKGVE
jgi:hypothetical protein